MTDTERLYEKLEEEGFIILDYIKNEYPTLKELHCYAGATSNNLEFNIIQQKFKDLGISLDINYFTLPDARNVIYNSSGYEQHEIREKLL